MKKSLELKKIRKFAAKIDKTASEKVANRTKEHGQRIGRKVFEQGL